MLTSKFVHSRKCKDGKNRNFMVYFLNGVEILKLKVPFQENWEFGFQDCHTTFENERIEGNRLHMTKTNHGTNNKVRQVSYPISKKKLELALQLSNLKNHSLLNEKISKSQ